MIVAGTCLPAHGALFLRADMHQDLSLPPGLLARVATYG